MIISEYEWDKYYRHSFGNFLWAVWRHLEHDTPPSEINYDMARLLQYGPSKLCIEALRGVGKSYETCAYAVWRLRNDPSEKILIVSAAEDKAKDNSTFIRELIYTMPLLAPLRLTEKSRRRKGRKPKDSVLSFDVEGAPISQAASVTCAGITSGITGKRATIIIGDDIEIPSNCATKIQRDKIELLVTEFDAIIKPEKGCKIIYLGTPHSGDSFYNKLPAKGYKVHMWPARVPDEKWLKDYGQFLGPCIKKMVDRGVPEGTPTEPRFDDWYLQGQYLAMGPTRYNLNYMLDTRTNDALRCPLRLSDLIIMDLDDQKAPVHVAWASSPELMHKDIEPACFKGDYCYRPMQTDPRWADYEDSIMIIDPSGRGADKTAVCVLKVLNAKLFCLHLEGFSGGYENPTLEAIARIALKHKVSKVLCEENFGDGMFTTILKPVLLKYHNCEIEGYWSSKQKEIRICDTLEPVMAQHRLVINKSVFRDEEKIAKVDFAHRFSHQLTRMAREKSAVDHDDLIDALAKAVEYLSEKLEVSEENRLDEYEEDLKQKIIDEFMEHAGLDTQESLPAICDVGYEMTNGLSHFHVSN